jgi:hypothetical protein
VQSGRGVGPRRSGATRQLSTRCSSLALSDRRSFEVFAGSANALAEKQTIMRIQTPFGMTLLAESGGVRSPEGTSDWHQSQPETTTMPSHARIADPISAQCAQPAAVQVLTGLDWAAIGAALDADGCAVIGPLLGGNQCAALAATYPSDAPFRSRIVMARHGFGRGEYKYFTYPLPPVVAALRAALYPELAAIANRWNEKLGIATRFPPEHDAFLERCHRAGQTRPTPLLLQYGPGDYNCLHQDLYGDLVFPLQVTVLLSRPGEDFSGGEFVLTEQRPRMQSRAEVVPLRQGEAVIFPVHHRPVQGTRGVYRVNLRHGVSRLRSGRRHTLGIIFHDAK